MKKMFSFSLYDFLHTLILFLFDTITVIFCFWAGHTLWVQSSFRLHPMPPQFGFASLMIITLIFIAVLIWGGTYQFHSSVIHLLQLRNLIRTVVIGYCVVVVIGFFTKSFLVSRLQAAYTLVLLTPLIVFERWLVDTLWGKYIARGIKQRRILIYGAGETGKRLVKSIRNFPKLNYIPIGFVDDKKRLNTQITANPLSVLGGLKDIPAIVKANKIDSLWIAIPRASRRKTLKVMEMCNSLGIPCSFVPSLNDLSLHSVQVDILDGVPLFGKRTLHITLFNRFVKRSFDIVLSIIVLILSAPFFGLIMWLIKRDTPGPAIFKQKRIGLKGEEFTIYKFRTMVEDTPQYAFNPTSHDDSRITRVGRFLRRLSLDEFPQFWNVLKGDMSIVGPRPEMPFIVETYNDVHRERLNVKPGITGLWQISGDRALPIHDNIDHDLYYIEHQSPLLDLVIVVETVIFAIRGVGAW